MLHAALLIALAVFHAARAQTIANSTLAGVVQAFQDAKIVPDVLASFKPTLFLDVMFQDQATQQSISVTPGVNLTMEQTMLEPGFFVTSNSTNVSFTGQTFVLAIVDPDAPTPQNTSESQFRHLLAGDIQVNSTAASGGQLVNMSAALTDFVNPTPPAGSDPHRYVVLLFNQPPNFDTVAPTLVNSSTPRNNFNLTTFGQGVGLGNPVAGNFFFTGPSNATSNTTATSTNAAPVASGTLSAAPSMNGAAALLMRAAHRASFQLTIAAIVGYAML